MCDYSLEYLTSRPAKVGDKLVTSAFARTVTRGFGEAGHVGECETPVCLLPGTEVAFDAPVEVDKFQNEPEMSIPGREARFRHINAEKKYEHHDALEFADGQVVILHRLKMGQTATVLQLPVTAAPPPAPSEAASAVEQPEEVA